MRNGDTQKDGAAIAPGDAWQRWHGVVRTRAEEVYKNSGAWKRSGGGRDRGWGHCFGSVHAWACVQRFGIRSGANRKHCGRFGGDEAGTAVVTREELLAAIRAEISGHVS